MSARSVKEIPNGTTKRRGNREGSVYRRGDGHVVGEYEDAKGKRRYVSGKTKAEVRTKLRKLLADRDKGIAYDSENLTLGGYLDRWLDAAKGSVRDRTWQRHEQVVRLAPKADHRRCEARQAERPSGAVRLRAEAGRRAVAALGGDHPRDAP